MHCLILWVYVLVGIVTEGTQEQLGTPFWEEHDEPGSADLLLGLTFPPFNTKRVVIYKNYN